MDQKNREQLVGVGACELGLQRLLAHCYSGHAGHAQGCSTPAMATSYYHQRLHIFLFNTHQSLNVPAASGGNQSAKMDLV
jgi:hypothetical protein